MSQEEVAISVKHLSKDFVLPHQKMGSVKSVFTNMFAIGNRTFETQHALKDISFDIKKGEFFGIVGRNGSGKSTLLKILAGIYQPTKGTVHTKGRIVPFIELGVGFNGELTGRENVYLNGALLGFSEKEVEEKYDAIVDFAELARFMDQKLKNYSSGMQVRLAFSVATVMAKSDILLIDEVLAVGDADFQRKCYRFFKSVKKEGKTVVFVSHDMNAIKTYCDNAVLIEKNEIIASGTALKVADAYSKLFLENTGTTSTELVNMQRWGSENLKISDIKMSVTEDKLKFNVTAKAKEDCGNVIYGIHFLANDGTELTAMNNRMINAKDLRVKKGDEISFVWELDNIFSDGSYSITLTLVDDEYNTLDWYTEAAQFSVRRKEQSTTSIFPKINVTTRYEK